MNIEDIQKQIQLGIKMNTMSLKDLERQYEEEYMAKHPELYQKQPEVKLEQNNDALNDFIMNKRSRLGL